MTKTQYLAMLKKLGLTPHSNVTADYLGTSRRQIQRYASGASIPGAVQLLLQMYEEHGLPDLEDSD